MNDVPTFYNTYFTKTQGKANARPFFIYLFVLVWFTPKTTTRLGQLLRLGSRSTHPIVFFFFFQMPYIPCSSFSSLLHPLSCTLTRQPLTIISLTMYSPSAWRWFGFKGQLARAQECPVDHGRLCLRLSDLHYLELTVLALGLFWSVWLSSSVNLGSPAPGWVSFFFLFFFCSGGGSCSRQWSNGQKNTTGNWEGNNPRSSYFCRSFDRSSFC
jgi:hypothetical protein